MAMTSELVYKNPCRTFVERLIGVWLGVIQGYFGWIVFELYWIGPMDMNL